MSIHAQHGATHPTTAARFVGMERAWEEVVRKKTAGADLVPDLRRHVRAKERVNDRIRRISQRKSQRTGGKEKPAEKPRRWD